jgi:hypothetical protein
VLKEIEILLRYPVHGYTLLLPLVLMVYFISPSSGEFIGLLYIALGFPVGYFLQQACLFMSERYGFPFDTGGMEKTRGGVNRIIKLGEKSGKKLSVMQALLVWDYFMYSERISEGLRNHDAKIIEVVENLRIVSAACILGAVTIIAGIGYLSEYGILTYMQTLSLVILFLIYIFLGTLVFYKSKQLLAPVMNLEEFIVEKHWGDIKELLSLAGEVCG